MHSQDVHSLAMLFSSDRLDGDSQDWPPKGGRRPGRSPGLRSACPGAGWRVKHERSHSLPQLVSQDPAAQVLGHPPTGS